MNTAQLKPLQQHQQHQHHRQQPEWLERKVRLVRTYNRKKCATSFLALVTNAILTIAIAHGLKKIAVKCVNEGNVHSKMAVTCDQLLRRGRVRSEESLHYIHRRLF